MVLVSGLELSKSKLENANPCTVLFWFNDLVVGLSKKKNDLVVGLFSHRLGGIGGPLVHSPRGN